jgi:hypothetical protein
MDSQDIAQVLRELHSIIGNPHLEIEGAGVPSIEAQWLGWMRHMKDGEGDKAVYVMKDWYEDTSYVTSFDVECLKLPKTGIESLVEYALSDGMKASLYTVGTHFEHKERWDDYNDSHDGGPAETRDELVELSLDLLGEKPVFSVRSLPFKPYPKDLPYIAVYNRVDLCINCANVWLEPFGGREPDSNHCTEMIMTWGTYKNLAPEERERFGELARSGVLCPGFRQTGRYSG